MVQRYQRSQHHQLQLISIMDSLRTVVRMLKIASSEFNSPSTHTTSFGLRQRNKPALSPTLLINQELAEVRRMYSKLE